MDLFSRIAEAQNRWNVLDHSFYRRWSAGELATSELRTYAGQYRHAVQAIADLSANAVQDAEPALGAQLAAHAAEEAEHVELWDQFAAAVGTAQYDAPIAQTERLRQTWTAGSGLLEKLVILYTIESAQPAIARTKLDGLIAHYGHDAAEPSTSYFAVHSTRDHDHAAQSRELIAQHLQDADADSLAALAEAALEANWSLLDGVEQAAQG